MDKKIKDLFTNAEFNPPAEEWEISNIEEYFEVTLPDDYKEFLYETDGVKGKIGVSDIDIWSAKIIPKLNCDNANKFLTMDEIIYFGTNGNNKIYAFYYKKNNIQILKIPMSCQDIGSCEVMAESFTDFLEKLSEEVEHEYNFQRTRVVGRRKRGFHFTRTRIKKERVNIDIDNTNICINQKESWSKNLNNPIEKKKEENIVIPIEDISSIKIKYRYGIFHLISVIIVGFILFCFHGNGNYYRNISFDKDLFFSVLSSSGFSILFYMFFCGYIKNQFPDKKIRIKKNDGTSIKVKQKRI